MLAEIEGGSRDGVRAGALRRRDLEAYGTVLERLGSARTVLVTGAPEAKRATAIGLAATAVAAGTRTALVECDLASPAIAETLGLAATPGLSEYLRGEAAAAQILKPAILAGPGSAEAIEPLVCIVAGRPVGDSWGLIASDRLQQALERLRSAYDLVTIDAPPLRDLRSLGVLQPHADSTIACLGAAESRRKLPVPVTGVVLRS